jgi:transposase InsO family protein
MGLSCCGRTGGPHGREFPRKSDGRRVFTVEFKRGYVSVHELQDAETVLAELGQWFDDNNRQAPHSALGMCPPTEYRARLELTPPSV